MLAGWAQLTEQKLTGLTGCAGPPLGRSEPCAPQSAPTRSR